MKIRDKLRTSRLLLRTIQCLEVVTIFSAIYSLWISERYYHSSQPFGDDLYAVPFIRALISEYFLLIVAMLLFLGIRRIANRYNERDGLLCFFYILVSLVATIILAPVMYLVLPLTVILLAIVGIFTSERSLRNLKPGKNETNMST